MRYSENQRRNYPIMEDKTLWSALTNLNLDYKPIANINPEQQDKRENWLIPALVFLPQPSPYASFGIVFKNDHRTGKQANNRTKIVMDRIIAKCKERNIPLLALSRKLNQMEMEWEIKLFITKMRKETK